MEFTKKIQIHGMDQIYYTLFVQTQSLEIISNKSFVYEVIIEVYSVRYSTHRSMENFGNSVYRET